MKKTIRLFCGSALMLTTFVANSQVIWLTDAVVFSTGATGNWVAPNTWNTRANDGYFKLWIKDASGFLNGPASANVRPNIGLMLGANVFQFHSDPGEASVNSGINLFFNGSSTPSISAFGPTLAADGAHSFSANSSLVTPEVNPNWGPVPFAGAGTLTFSSGQYDITLSDFYQALPSVYNLDAVGGYSVGSNGLNDFVGGFTLTVAVVPEPQIGLWVLSAMAFLFIRRKQ